MRGCALKEPNHAELAEHVRANGDRPREMAAPLSRVGHSVVICGAGPSLARYEHLLPETDEVWACNRALPHLRDAGHRVTHGFAIDTGAAMAQEWARTFDVTYLLASNVRPELVRHLEMAYRRLVFFHNSQGGPPVRSPLYPPPFIETAYGFCCTSRAVSLAVAMGFDLIMVYGADCACLPDGPPMVESGQPDYADWLAALTFYAGGETALSVLGPRGLLIETTIDGRRWATRPDMAVDAKQLRDLQRMFPHRISLIGDTLPNAMHYDDPAFMAEWPRLVHEDAVVGIAGFGAGVAASDGRES